MNQVHDEVRLDWARRERTGLAEAVMCEGKTTAQLQHILGAAEDARRDILFTRLEYPIGESLRVAHGNLDYDRVSRTAIYRAGETVLRDSTGALAVVTGGSADMAVAREAIRTLAFHGHAADGIFDVGVAGLWRVQEQQARLAAKQVIICAAGMDAALPTVLGGLVPGLIIAVPTSVGYGTAEGGRTALNALLCSCAQGLVVVNIDNGFGAACAALRALNA